MFNSFSAALSAMSAHSTAVDVVGNNLANVNTAGYKASNVAFKDLVSESMSARNETGMGVSRPITVRTFTQGAIQSSPGKLDGAIQGNGFFVVKDASGSLYYTRDGSFQLDSNNVLRTLTGETVQQLVSGQYQDIRVSSAPATASPTTKITIGANLNAAANTGDTFAAPIEVVDSLGMRHQVTITYTKTAANKWSYDVTVPAADLATAPTSPLATGTIDFNTDGSLKLVTPGGGGTGGGASNAPVDFSIQGFANGAADLSLAWQLLDANQKPTLSQSAQASALYSTSQDGTVASEMVDVALVDGGVLMARYGTGEQKPVGVLAMALVSNPETLTSAGNNLYRATADTAQVLPGTPGIGGCGNIKAQALEASTVDIAHEFTNLIVYQRGYQANSRVITTADEMSQETLNLKR